MSSSDYARIASAIAYIQANINAQPELADIARQVHLSPYHFQRLFTRWAGTTPKRFLQVLTLELGKHLLSQNYSILDTAAHLGLSSPARLHDHFVQIEGITPGEFKAKNSALIIRYGVADTLFGPLFVAQTPRGICRAVFIEDANPAAEITNLHQQWPAAQLINSAAAAKDFAQHIFELKKPNPGPINLHVQGTNFQLAVWRALLRIPLGRAISYGDLAAHLGKPSAARAVGTAVGANPIAVIIPCHRVIQQSGALGGYRWGLVRKQAIQVWERLESS
ncbi:MAG: methylated-DNA--[protein]-cysteine S-methyltransferase [Marinagarivorans sp.]